MTAASDFKGDYAPGGLTTRSKWRAIGRRGGLASGRRRRALSPGRRPARRRTRDEALHLAYRNRQVTRQEFERIYRRVRPTGNEGGLETAWTHYRGLFTRYRRDGQHYKTTNGQRGTALSSQGRPRCRRQVQRLNRLMEEMGLAVVSHFKDQQATPGHRDCLVVEIRCPRSKNVTPPSGARTPVPGVVLACSESTDRRPDCEGRASPSRVPPAPPADENEAATPPSTERERLEQAIAFQQLKLDMGWHSPLLRVTLVELKRRLATIERSEAPPQALATPALSSPQAPQQGSGDPHTAR